MTTSTTTTVITLNTSQISTSTIDIPEGMTPELIYSSVLIILSIVMIVGGVLIRLRMKRRDREQMIEKNIEEIKRKMLGED